MAEISVTYQPQWQRSDGRWVDLPADWETHEQAERILAQDYRGRVIESVRIVRRTVTDEVVTSDLMTIERQGES